jgi:Right handed beta helix region
MLFFSSLRMWKCTASEARRRTPKSARQRVSSRPRLEVLDDRCLPSGLPYPTAANVSQLVSDISYADNTGGKFTINLKPSTIFELKSVNNTTNGANGLPVIGGTRAVDLTLTGSGDTIERVGSKQFCLFNVAPRASLRLDHVKLQQTLNSYGSGVAINNHGTLVVSYCTVSNISGGGISNNGGTVTVSNSTLSGNAASNGGGISNSGGTVTVSDSTLSSNNAIQGGGIYNNGGTVTVSNSTLSGNSATYGGGIDNVGGTVTVSNNSTLSSNYTSPDYFGHGGYGGAIYNSGGTVMIRNSILSGNAAYVFGLDGGGGGIYNDSHGTVTVENSSSITGNDSGIGEDVSIEDVLNLGVLYLDRTSTIGILDGNPAIL